jgi:uncharacterized protein YecT (DUF1311 family)
MKNLLALLLFFLPFMTLANSACDRPKNNFDGLYCLNKVYQETDKELNDTYKKLKNQLDKNGNERLKDGQLAWIKQRNENCSKLEADQFYVNLECATNSTIERLRFIQDRSRECSSSGCQNSKL